MGSGAIIHIPSFVKICSDIQKLVRGIHRPEGYRIRVLRKVRVKEVGTAYA
jgi:hypothetical protein